MKKRFGYRFFGLFIIATVALAGLQSCGGSGASDGRTVIRFAHSITSGAAKDVIDWTVQEFEKKNPTVHIEQITMSDDVYEDLGLISLFQGRHPPDVYYQWGGWLVQRDARDNRAADLTDVLNQDSWREEFLPNAWIGTESEGRTYMVPTMVHVSTLLWYNQELFTNLTLSAPQTWDDFLQTCEAAQQAGIVPIAIGNKELWPLGNWAAHILSRVIGEDEYSRLFQLEEGKSFTDPGVVRALEYVQNLARQKYFLEGMIALEDEEGQAHFRTNRALYHPIGNWVIPIWVKEVSQLQFDCFNTPAILEGQGDQSSVLGLISGFMIYKNTPNFEVSLAYLKELNSIEAQQRFMQVGQYSTLKKAYEGEIDPHLKRVMEIFAQAKTIVPPPDTGFNVSVADAFYSAVQAVAGKRSAPLEALKEADREARRHGR